MYRDQERIARCFETLHQHQKSIEGINQQIKETLWTLQGELDKLEEPAKMEPEPKLYPPKPEAQPQLFPGPVLIGDFAGMFQDNLSIRLYNILRYGSFTTAKLGTRFKYLAGMPVQDLTKDLFLRVPRAGLVSWQEFESLRSRWEFSQLQEVKEATF